MDSDTVCNQCGGMAWSLELMENPGEHEDDEFQCEDCGHIFRLDDIPEPSNDE